MMAACGERSAVARVCNPWLAVRREHWSYSTDTSKSERSWCREKKSLERLLVSMEYHLRLPCDPIKRNKLLLKLDQYEGVNPDEPARSLFVRRQLCVNLRSGRKLKCWAYEYN